MKSAAATAATIIGIRHASGEELSSHYLLQGAEAQVPDAIVSNVNGIGRRTLGKSGAEVSIIGIGGYHLGYPMYGNRIPSAIFAGLLMRG